MSRPPTITDEALIAAARAVFIEKGPRATTAEIAERAGVSEGILFKRFGNKAALLKATITSGMVKGRFVLPIAATLGALAVSPRAYALQPLAEFVRNAAERNFDNRKARATAVQREHEASQAWARLLPTLTLQADYIRNQYLGAADIPSGAPVNGVIPTRHVVMTPINQGDASFQAALSLIDVAAWNNVGTGVANREAQKARAEATSLEVQKTVARTYYQLIGATAVARAARHTLAASEDNARYIETRAAAGLASELDLKRALAEAERNRQAVEDADYTAVTLRRSLGTLSGLAPEGDPVSDAPVLPLDDLREEPPLPVLTNQQLGVFLGLLSKNTMFIDNAGANLWIVPESTQTLQAGKPVAMSVLYEARTTPGVAWAEPLLFGGATVSLPKGGSEPITLVGTKAPCCRGGPWNMVAGSADALRRPDTMIFEDSERDKLGGLNLGSVREVNRHRTVVGGFTWGLLPFGPSYAFADYDYARVLMGTPSDETSFVLIGLAPGADRAAVTRALKARVTGDEVLSTEEFHNKVLKYLLVSTGIGATTGMSTAFGLLVGLIIVSLSMFSSVIDNIREFGTLKAIGCRNRDLALMLLVQSSVYALLGSMIGLGMISGMADGIRSPKLALVLPWVAYATTPLAMVILCELASLLALSRIRKVEPAMVFR